MLIPAQCTGHTYKRGNEDTSIKGKAKGGRGSGRCQDGKFTVSKIMQKTETTADKSIADKPQLCSFLASSAFISRFFLLPAPVSSGQRPSPPTGSKKCIKKLKSQQTPLSSVPSVIINTSLPFHPSRKADPSDGSVCEGSPPRSPHQRLHPSFCPCASRNALSGFPSTTHVPCRSQRVKDLNVMSLQ